MIATTATATALDRAVKTYLATVMGENQ